MNPELLASITPVGSRSSARTAADAPVQLSLVVPAFDEAANLPALHARILEVFGARNDWELIVVDDGSRDGTAAVLRELALRDPRVTGIVFAMNCGQTSAIAAGIGLARGKLVATLDADLQNDPRDLPGLIAALGEHDAVVGFRVGRKDGFVKHASSRIANAIRNRLSKDSIRDTGCSLKVFRAEAIRSIPWFEGMHRFLPTLLRQRGFSVVERPVSHHPRLAGESKYGVWNRAGKGLGDLLVVRWMRQRSIRRPIREILRAR
jgi:glycosyltransferase involved in cell wall biosynthesis